MAPSEDIFVRAERGIQRALAHLPTWMNRFLGYRGKPAPPSTKLIVCIWGFIGAFGGVGIILAIFTESQYFTSRHVPAIVASYGASAILCYGSIDVPLAQPRALIFGHFFSGLVGVIIKVIFNYSFPEDGEGFPRLMWLAACLATSIALVIMHLTKTTHPPAGATALLPCVDRNIHALGWYFLPVLLLSSALILVSALLVNNIQRQYPKFWIAPIPPSPPAQPKDQQSNPPDLEKADSSETPRSHTLPITEPHESKDTQ
ncbi:hypothetical protein PMIN06_005822 [Paraphaeosphaeria minitans]|uniref:HPP family protein n=1 Tax=Paraphaeosphaeria minitans TaxID=565426 RepID=A0A9P6G952_9PLEO|nr:HPP family protein [Paraphaeosphaeria minitans]